jgi:hypothetical protein
MACFHGGRDARADSFSRKFAFATTMRIHYFFQHANQSGSERKERFNRKILFSRIVEEQVKSGL